jgi:flagellar basal body P-ring protein FlgI
VKAAGIKKEDSMKKSMKTINKKSIYTQEIMKVLKAVKAAGIKKEDSMKKSMKTINEKSIYTQEIMKVLKAMKPEEEITYDDLSERVSTQVKV